MKYILLFSFFSLTTLLQSQETVYLELQPVELTSTEKIYDLIIDDFENIIGWQYSMVFDHTKMRFKEIRNSVLDDLDNHDFNEPIPGILLTVWIDQDLEPADYPDPTVAYQLVFELFEAGGSTVCLSESPLSYEFIMREVPGFSLSEVVITDDCLTGHPVSLISTATDNASDPNFQSLQHLYLSSEGELSFTNTISRKASLQLFDVLGRSISLVKENTYDIGRHTVHIDKILSEGMYILQVREENGRYVAYQVITQ